MPALVVMAAGLGVRFGGLKQLAPVGPHGEVILDYSAHDAVAAGFEQIVLIVRSEIGDQIRSHVEQRWPASLPVEFVLQDKDAFSKRAGRAKPLGTAHAVLCARAALNDSFAVINADDLYGPKCYRVLAAHLSGGDPNEHALVGFRLLDTVPAGGDPVMRGVCQTDADGHLTGITETEVREGAPDAVVSMNMWGFRRSIFEALERAVEEFVASPALASGGEVLLPTVVGRLIADGEATVRVLPAEDRWVGLTYSADLTAARHAVAELVAAGVEPATVWANT